jgi:hypothetical protein
MVTAKRRNRGKKNDKRQQLGVSIHGSNTQISPTVHDDNMHATTNEFVQQYTTNHKKQEAMDFVVTLFTLLNLY